MKFDCIIMNPPYGSRASKTSITLHYSITEKTLNYLNNTGKCVCLMPITLIKSSVNTKAISKFKKSFDTKLLSIEELDGNIYFDTWMKEIGIYEFSTNKNNSQNIDINTIKKQETVKSLFNFNYHLSNNEIILLNKLKIGNFAGNRRQKFQTFVAKKNLVNDDLKSFVQDFINKRKTYFNKYDIFVMFNAANGGINGTWQSDILKKIGIVTKDNIEHVLLTNNCSMKSIIGFKNSEFDSVKNILKLIETNCLRYPLYKMQDDQNMCPRVYTYFPDIDYSNIDTEEKFYNHFNITKEEQKIIEETIAKYK